MPTSSSATAESSGSNVPAFLSKLWRLVEDPKYDSIISWSDSGQSFTIHDQTQFAKDVLPLYFKHNNMASFIRQLNMYGFRKVVNVDSGGLKGYKEDIEFYHNFFNRGQEATLEFIKRKAPGHQKSHTTTAPAGSPVPRHDNELRTELVRELLTDVNQLQGKQEKVDSQLVEMKRENEALWREVAVLRRKHLKQQQIVEKLIHFLASLVHQARAGTAENNISMKRKHTLMIDEEGNVRKTLRGPVVAQPRQAAATETRIPEIDSGPIISDITYEHSPSKPRVGSTSSRIGKGHELTIVPSGVPIQQANACGMPSPESTAELTDEVVLCENLFDEEVDLAPNINADISSKVSYQSHVRSPEQATVRKERRQPDDFQKFEVKDSLNTPQVEVWEEDEDEDSSPGTSAKTTLAGSRSTSIDDNSSMQVVVQAPATPGAEPDTPLSKNKEGLHDHLEGVETELDWLQDQLLAGGLNIDSNTLINIFNTDIANLADDTSGSNADSQVVSYQNPSFLDLISDADDEENILKLQTK